MFSGVRLAEDAPPRPKRARTARPRLSVTTCWRAWRGAPKSIPPKWFYDAHGSELFEAITELPEYYPTRTETALLSRDRARARRAHPARRGR